MNYNAIAHRLALSSDRNASVPSPQRVSSYDLPTNRSTGVFHLGVSGPRNETYYRRKGRRIKPSRKTRQQTTSCNICMDTIPGNVTLKCGHEMCPECYAMHSRVNNTCPYCRDVFAPELKKEPRLRMPIQEAETMVDQNVREYYTEDMKDELMSLLANSGLSETDTNNIELAVYCHLYQISMNTYHIIDDWLEDYEE